MLDNRPAAVGHYEPAMSMTVLRGCVTCGHKHPLAYTPPMPADKCPGCGRPVQAPSAPMSVPAVVTDVRLAIGNLLLRIGAKLHRLNKRIGG